MTGPAPIGARNPLLEEELLEEAGGLEALRQELDSAVPALSQEVEEREPEELLGAQGLQDEFTRKAMEQMYSPAFPLLDPEPDEESWATWARELWMRHEPGIRSRLHLVQRNRLFRRGIQWISSQGTLGPWKEPPKPRDAARTVYNMISPALDQRVQIVSEQKPGFRVNPASQDPEDLKKAEAAQVAIEYQVRQQRLDEHIREASYWVGTDGVTFWEVYWDPEEGPWHEFQGGQGQPLQKAKIGDVCIKHRRIENVRVSSNASATKRPWYWVIREIIPRAQAVKEYGSKAATEVADASAETYASTQMVPSFAQHKSGFLLPQEEELLREQETTDRITVYCEPTEFLPQGLQLVVVGGKVLVGPMPLLCGSVPMVRITDGSSDPSFYPRPVMDDWVDSQVRVNAILSKWVENIRLNAGPKILAKMNSIVGETLIGSTMSVISVKGLDGLDQLVRPLQGMSLAADAKELFEIEKKAFEDLTGWNDASRGNFSTDQSGRAILAIRDTLEKIFSPPIAAQALAITEWARISLAWMRWGYDIPRTMAVEGKQRPDLARALSSEDFDGIVDIFVDPETMMPMPRALRLFLLEDALTKGIIGVQEYRRRLPFAFVGNLETPDTDQEASARRLVEFIRTSAAPPIPTPTMWVWDEAIHQDALQRELLLPAGIPPQVQMAAMGWWTMLAQQAMMKMGLTPQSAPAASTGGGSKQGASKFGPMAKAGGMSPSQQPLLSQNPSVSAGPTMQQNAGQSFDARSQR